MECKDEWNWNNTALLCGEQYYRTEWYVLHRKSRNYTDYWKEVLESANNLSLIEGKKIKNLANPY